MKTMESLNVVGLLFKMKLGAMGWYVVHVSVATHAMHACSVRNRWTVHVSEGLLVGGGWLVIVSVRR